MKRIIATILVSLMLMSTAYATATFEYNGGKIGDLNIDTSIQGKVTSYLYNDNTYSFTVNNKDFEKLNQLFSDQNLTNSQKSFNEPMTGNMSDYPKGGKYTIKELYDNENKYSTTLEFAFDSNGVLLSEILLSTDSINHILRQGYYTYNSRDIYNQIKSILDEYAKIEEEKTINDKYELKANELKISNLKILYTATFSDSKLSMNGDNKWTWGICSYKYDKGETVTRAFLSLLDDNKGTKYFVVSDIGLQNNNTIYFSGNTDILFYGSENFGKENTKSETLYSFKLQFNISDNLQIEDLVYSHTHKYTNVSQTINIDMNKYVGDKTLPELSAFKFSSANNLILPEEKFEENKEDTKIEEKVEQKEDKKEEETDTFKKDNEDDEIQKEGDGTPPRAYTFEELTSLSRDDIDHIIIRSGMNGINYSTAYDKVITDIYNAINTKSFLPYVKEGNSGGWSYEIIFFDKANKKYTYNFSSGITPESGFNGLSYRSENEELKAVVEKAYNLISNDCSEWSSDYIVQASDLGFLKGITDILYKENITREKFCEIVYNMLDKTMNVNWKTVSTIPFKDTLNQKVFSLAYEGIINGKGENTFAPNDILTREESATILYRLAEYMELDMPQSTYNESIKYYADKDMISEWAFNAVFYMKEMGIMVGTSDTEFSPKDTYTVEQAIATVIRLYNQK